MILVFWSRVVDKEGHCRRRGGGGRFSTRTNRATGFEQIELSCHGGAGASAAVEETLLKAGFERATGADLLARAHLNQKMSLVAVEAQSASRARGHAHGKRNFLLGARRVSKALGTAWLRRGDGVAHEGFRCGARDAATRRAARIARCGAAQAALLRPVHAALIGPANAGKSTLANRLGARGPAHRQRDCPARRATGSIRRCACAAST